MALWGRVGRGRKCSCPCCRVCQFFVVGEERVKEHERSREGREENNGPKSENSSCNIPSLINYNPHLATNMRPLIGFAPPSHCVDTLSAGIVHLCKGTHLVVISDSVCGLSTFPSPPLSHVVPVPSPESG